MQLPVTASIQVHRIKKRRGSKEAAKLVEQAAKEAGYSKNRSTLAGEVTVPIPAHYSAGASVKVKTVQVSDFVKRKKL